MAGHLKRQSIRKAITRVVMLCLGLSAVFIAISIQLIETNFSTTRLADDLRMVGNLIADRSLASIRFSDSAAAKNNLSTAKFNPHIEKLCLYTNNGKLFSQYVAQTKPEIYCSSTTPKVVNNGFCTRGGEINILIPLIEDGERLGYLAIAGNLDIVTRQQLYMLLLQLVVFLFAAAICYLVASHLLTKKLAPLAKLNKMAMTIVEDPFSVQRAPLENNDEIGDLVTAFNQMLDNLANENSALLVSEQRFRILADHSPIGIYFKDASGNMVYANEKWYEFSGLNSTYTFNSFFSHINPSDKENYEKKLQQATADRCLSVVEYRCTDLKINRQKALMEYMSPLIDTETEDQHVVGLIGSVLDITDLKHAQHELEKLAFYDPLTKLPNRRFFNDHLNFRLASAKKGYIPLAILLIDLDNFKRINDSLGHDAGDKLLAVIAKRLRDEVFAEDVVSRMGGDEFIVFIESASSDEMIDTITQRILQVVTKPVNIALHAIEVTCSIGISRYPQDADSAEDLIRNADIALYRAKALGRNCVAHFSAELDKFVQEKIHLETKLRHAIIRNAFELYIQPQYDGIKSRFVWAEVLLRWQLDNGDFIPPDKFIPVAEETGLIIRLGNWVISETCRILVEHGDALTSIGVEGLSVNVSARQFYHKNFLSSLKSIIQDYGVDPGKIEIEITESMVMEDVSCAIATMTKLRELGFRISIDDFGTGYSSLSYLKNFDIDSVKIDKSFIDELPQNENNAAITTAVLAMAEKLNLAVIAEGVETEAQSNFLLAQGCSVMQGYYYSKPMPVSQLLANLLDIPSNKQFQTNYRTRTRER